MFGGGMPEGMGSRGPPKDVSSRRSCAVHVAAAICSVALFVASFHAMLSWKPHQFPFFTRVLM